MNRFAGVLWLAMTSLTFGQNALRVDVSGEWRWRAEDRPVFAESAFDDAAWTVFVLPRGARHAQPGYEEIRGWLRRRVQLPAGVDRNSLALTLGTVADAYEVWVNGQRVGRSGDFESLADAHIPHPLTFDLPDSVIPPNGDLVIALRVRWAFWAPPVFSMDDRGPYLITLRTDAPRQVGAEQMGLWRERHSLGLMFGTVFLLIALLSLVAWRSDPLRGEFGWFGVVSFVYAYNAICHTLEITPASQPYNHWGVAPVAAIVGCSMYPFFTQFVAVSLGYRYPWLHFANWAGWSLLPLSTLLGWNQRIWANAACMWTAGLATMLIVLNWRRIPWTRAALPDHLFRLILFVQAVGYLELWSRYLLGYSALLPEWYMVGPYSLWRENVLWLPVSTGILLLMIRRVAADRQEQQRLTGELSAARTVQQLLFAPLGEGSPVEAVYEPALEVGGDFYQVFPLPGGGHLVAVGDVSGKGLKAAMVVSLLAGVLRNRHSDEPVAVLGELNRAVAGGGLGGGFVTASVARCGPEGVVTLASAGHPAPYLAGEEVAVVSGLPLGIDEDAEYAGQTLVIPPGAQLAFVSDGVVEAENASRELFGFERTREISTKSAQEIAKAAKAWGQNDDITVVTVRRK